MNDMTYELTKQLKDAGYKFKKPNCGEPFCATCSEIPPTLSELIEACMEIILKHNSDETWLNEDLWFFQLAPNINSSGISTEIGKVSEWRATLDKGGDLDNISEGSNYFGSTPEEAVAKLWLELNKK